MKKVKISFAIIVFAILFVNFSIIVSTSNFPSKDNIRTLDSYEIAGSGTGFCEGISTVEEDTQYSFECGRYMVVGAQVNTVCDGSFGTCIAGVTAMTYDCIGHITEYFEDHWVSFCL